MNEDKTQRKRTIPEHKMTSDANFVFGKLLVNPNREPTWNPDTVHNPHVMIWGESGSGKSRLTKKLIEYLSKRRKTVHVIDLHGDLKAIDDEVLHVFSSRNSKFGINPFEFYLDEQNGGPGIQAQEIIAMFKKAFFPKNTGPLQTSALQSLIRDTYRSKGIYEEDPSSWGFGTHGQEWYKKIPTLNDMKELLEHIRDSVRSGFGLKFTKTVMKNGQLLRSLKEELDRSEKLIASLTGKRSKEPT